MVLLTFWSPKSFNESSTFWPTKPQIFLDRQTSSDRLSASSWAATLTPWLYRLVASMITSPILSLMWKCILASGSTDVLRSRTSFWNFVVQMIAETALWNSARTESPAVLKMRPLCSWNRPSKIARRARRLFGVKASLRSIKLLKPTTSVTHIPAFLRISRWFDSEPIQCCVIFAVRLQCPETRVWSIPNLF